MTEIRAACADFFRLRAQPDAPIETTDSRLQHRRGNSPNGTFPRGFKPLFQTARIRSIPRPARDWACPPRPSADSGFARSSVIVLSCASFQQHFTFIHVLFNLARSACAKPNW